MLLHQLRAYEIPFVRGSIGFETAAKDIVAAQPDLFRGLTKKGVRDRIIMLLDHHSQGDAWKRKQYVVGILFVLTFRSLAAVRKCLSKTPMYCNPIDLTVCNATHTTTFTVPLTHSGFFSFPLLAFFRTGSKEDFTEKDQLLTELAALYNEKGATQKKAAQAANKTRELAVQMRADTCKTLAEKTEQQPNAARKSSGANLKSRSNRDSEDLSAKNDDQIENRDPGSSPREDSHKPYRHWDSRSSSDSEKDDGFMTDYAPASDTETF